jgi:mannitol-specific phosphotransferase system IIBC component
MDNSTRAGTAGGTFLAFIANLGNDDILKTVILTMVGAVVSFLVSLVLQWLVKWVRKRRMRNETPG